MTDIDFRPYALDARDKSFTYIKTNIDGSRMAGDTPLQHAQIRAFHLRGPHPYHASLIERATQSTLADTLAGAEPAGKKWQIVYLAGPLSSNQMLVDALANPDIRDESITQLRQQSRKGFRISFARLKEVFTKHSGISILKQPYPWWRPLLSGMDQVLVGIAEKYKIPLLKDDTLTEFSPDPIERQKGIKQNLDAVKNKVDAGHDVHIYAVLLTPDQAEREARKLGMSPEEARRTAEGFAEQWENLCKATPNATIFKPEFDPVTFKLRALQSHFIKRDGEVVISPDRPGGTYGGGYQMPRRDVA
jgi:hypothetical protein